jgi:MFS family permease
MSVPPAEPVRESSTGPTDKASAKENGAASSSTKDPGQSGGSGWIKPVIPVAVIALCAEMGTSVLNNSTLPVYFKNGLKIGTDVIALLMIPFFISEVLFKSPLGVLADKIGRKPLMLFGCLMTVVTPMILKSIIYQPGTSTALAALFGFGFLRLLDGLGGAALWPSLFAYVGDEVPEEKRSTAMGLLNLMYMLGLALSFYIAGKLDDNFDPVLTGQTSLRGQIHRIGHRVHEMVQNLGHHHHPGGPGVKHDLLNMAMSNPAHYRPSMYLVTLLFALASLVCAFGLRNRRNGTHHHDEAETVTWQSFVSALHRIPEFLLLAFVTFFGIGSIAGLVKIFAVDEFHMTEQRIGLLMLVTALIIASLAYPLGRLGDTWGKSRSVRLGFILCGVGLWGIPLLHSMRGVHAVAFVVSAAIMGIGFVIAFPAWNALLTSLSDESHRATVFGAVSTAQGIGVLLGYLTGGWLYKHVSHIAPFTASATLVTTGAILALLFVRDRRLQHRI